MTSYRAASLHALAVGFAVTASGLYGASLAQAAPAVRTATPIKHVIIVVGENHTFDNLYGTYVPRAGQRIDNLLSKGIVNADGSAGPRFELARQNIGTDTGSYRTQTENVGSYASLPQPYTTWASPLFTGLPANALDTRFPANLPNGPYQISKFVPYAAYTGDPVHRFFQMWQDLDGGRNDKFVWVEQSIGTGSNGQPVPAGGFNPMEGAISMGFYNMNPYVDAQGVAKPGDAPVFKALADQYAISDNYHQAILGGTGANFQALVTGHAAFFTDPYKLDGSAAVPYANQIENPDPVVGTDNYYAQDGYGGGSYVNCADHSAPGVAAVSRALDEQGVEVRNCAPGHYYLVNNYSMYWNQSSGNTPNPLGPTHFVLPPQNAPTIADVLSQNGVAWKYYSADRAEDSTLSNVSGIPLYFHFYCGICDPLTGYSNVMRNSVEEAKLQSYSALLRDLKSGDLPAVSFVRPFEALAGHPADSTSSLYEAFLLDLINKVKANPAVWASTAIFITTDEGGGYYDSGYVQALDFFGDGTRIPMVVVSPYARSGYVDHTYTDHVSLLKFIERNWRLPSVSQHSRDNLPNPRASRDPYRPANVPAIGDMMSLFDFNK
jgi:acid phosphatase